MSENPPKKKRISGGSFCAEGSCTNNSNRNKTSDIPGRGFLRYYNLPKDPERRNKWVARMKRQFGWKPSDHTKICSDHFYSDDFVEADVLKYKQNEECGTNTKHLLRLKKDATPNTDRATGEHRDPLKILAAGFQRPPPKERAPDSTSFYILEVDDVLQVQHEYQEEDEDDEQLQAILDQSIDSDDEKSDDEDSTDADSDLEYVPDSDGENWMTDFDDNDLSDDADDLWDDEEVQIADLSPFLSSDAKFQWTLVSIPLLLSLFRYCPQCGAHCRVTKVWLKGFAFSIGYQCSGLSQHEGTWHSSPINKKYFDINLKLPAMATMCGLGYTLLENVMAGLRIPYITHGGFYKNIKLNLYPVIVRKWNAMRTSIIQKLVSGGKSCDVAGDGHFDSPGWTAKYCTYSIMDIDTGAIIDFFIAQRGMYFGDLEMESAKEVLSNLVNSGLKINRFVTDENNKISKMVRENFKTIVHCLDIWHKARLLKKKLTKLAKKHSELTKWIPKLVNHFWYSCQKCEGDPQVLLENFHSCLLHICNKHGWVNDPLKKLKDEIWKEREKKRKNPLSEAEKKKRGPGLPFFETVLKCSHKTRMRHRRLRGIEWLDIEGDAYKSLFRYLTDTKFCNSLRKCCQFLHTGGLEVYHNVRLKLLPKRTSYSLVKMIMSSMLVAIDVNSNLLGSENIKRKKGWKWSRSQKKYVPKHRILKKDYSFRQDLIKDMMAGVMSSESFPSIQTMLEGYYLKRPIPQRMVDVEFPAGPPTLQRSRFE